MWQLFDYCKESFIRIDDQSMDWFNADLLDCFPQWHYVPYSSRDFGRCIEHIYYASQRSDPREILYKAGLENIAYNLDRIPKVNLIGSTASRIIGHDFSIKLLRILNQQELIDVLYEVDSTEHDGEVYKTYANFIGKDIPSANQWRYLDRLYSDNGEFAGMEFNRSLYRHLAFTSNKHILDSYRRYFELFENLQIEKSMRIPKAVDLWEATEKLERLQEYCEERLDLDEQIRHRKNFGSPVYEYSDDSYIVTMPGSCVDICKESISQDNYLMDYICDHASGETTILFLRKKDKPYDSYVTMEVKNWQIKQVYGYCNTLPEKDVCQFLIEKYSKDKCFLIDLQSIIDCYLDDEDEIAKGNYGITTHYFMGCQFSEEDLAYTPPEYFSRASDILAAISIAEEKIATSEQKEMIAEINNGVDGYQNESIPGQLSIWDFMISEQTELIEAYFGIAA